jgi:methylated-DNA-[protein]-cysteine S-methyltransferase
MRLSLDRYSSPIGIILLITDETGVLRALDFEEYETRMRRLLRLHYGEVALSEGKAPPALGAALDAYFTGDLTALNRLPVATGGTEFQRKVWSLLRDIAPGTTLSYGALAAQLGHPKASRAVGLANGANPIGIVVPCHRVIGASGRLTGYAGGLVRKRWLLDHENAPVRN